MLSIAEFSFSPSPLPPHQKKKRHRSRRTRRRCTRRSFQRAKWSPSRLQSLPLVQIQIPQFCPRCERLCTRPRTCLGSPRTLARRQGRAPTRGSRKQKRGSHDRREPSSCCVWIVQTHSQSKSLWKRREVNVVFSLRCKQRRSCWQSSSRWLSRGLADLERLRAEAQVTPVATSDQRRRLGTTSKSWLHCVEKWIN